MKKWYLMALGFFAGAVLVFQPIYSVDSAEDEVTELQRSMDDMTKKIRENLQNHPDSKDFVIVIGPTGGGKSTVVTCFAEKPLEAQKQNKKNILDTVDPLPNVLIGHTSRPGTVLPGVWYDPKTRISYWDCCGFGDPRGAKQDIINAFSAEQLFSAASGIKVLLVVEESKVLVERGASFVGLLDKITKFFPDNDQLKKSLSLVVTKQMVADPQTDFQRMLNDPELNGNEYLKKPRVRDLLQFLADNTTARVASFPYPQALGGYDLGSRQAMLDVIQSFEFEKPAVNVVIPERSDYLVEKLAQRLNDALTDYIRTQGSEQIINYCLRKIDAHEVGSVQNLREQFLGLLTALKAMAQISQETPMAFADHLSFFFDVEVIRSKINTISFLKKLNGGVTYQMADWFQALNNALVGLENLALIPDSVIHPIINDDGVIELNGILLGMSDVRSALNTFRLRELDTAIHEVRINVLHTFFFDEDIIAPSLSMGLIAPAHKVLGERKEVNFRGADGSHGNDGVNAVAGDGQPGEPGQHGGHGGHFYGKGHTFSHLDRLTINTSGGNGGNGGHGGKGANGVDGIDGDWSKKVCTESVYQDEQALVDCPTADRNAWYERHWRETYLASGTDGTPGHNGGQGGQRGNGGFAGTALIEGCGGVPWIHVSQNGVPGDHDGNPGAFGEGGVHGANLTGIVYIKREKMHRVRTGRGGTKWRFYENMLGISKPVLRTIRGGRANNPNPGQGGLNSINQRPQAAVPTPVDDETLCQVGRVRYDEQLALPGIGRFAKAFPSL